MSNRLPSSFTPTTLRDHSEKLRLADYMNRRGIAPHDLSRGDGAMLDAAGIVWDVSESFWLISEVDRQHDETQGDLKL